MYNVGIIAGSFDLLHPGYIRMFKESKEICKRLVIALQDDPTLDRPQKCKPVQTWEERKEILDSVKYIDEILYYSTESDLLKILETYRYDVRILGGDYIGERFNGDHLEKPIYFCSRNHKYSLTNLKSKIAQSFSIKI